MEKLARKLVIVSNDEYPREVQNGEVTTRYDLRSMYDEADYKIPQHVNRSIQEGNISVKVISARYRRICITLIVVQHFELDLLRCLYGELQSWKVNHQYWPYC